MVGRMTFQQTGPDQGILVTFDLENAPPNAEVRLDVTSLPPLLAEEGTDACDTTNLGFVYRLRDGRRVGLISDFNPISTNADGAATLSYLNRNLTMYGSESILYRGIRVFVDGRRTCATILPATEMLVAEASLQSGVVGRILFMQDASDPEGDLTIFVDIAADSTSLDHGWHIHENGAGTDRIAGSTALCSSTGGHYNPANVNTAGDYTSRCRTDVALCEAGEKVTLLLHHFRFRLSPPWTLYLSHSPKRSLPSSFNR